MDEEISICYHKDEKVLSEKWGICVGEGKD